MISLIIDDDPAMTDLMRMLLMSSCSEVHTANNGLEGIEKARKVRPDFVLLDMMMPDMDGVEVCRSIRAFSQIPIIILSALDRPAMIADILNAGADDYLIKPITGNVLFAHINKLMRRNGNATHPPQHTCSPK